MRTIDGDEMTLTLSSPITEEQFNAITDVDFDNTDRIWFHTKHGKDVEFVKRKKGKWIYKNDLKQFFCSECGFPSLTYDDVYIYSMDLPNYCEDCGADMREDQDGKSN